MSEFLKKIKTKFGHIPLKEAVYVKAGIEPHKDWMILVVSGCIAISVLAVFSYSLHARVQNGTLYATTGEETLAQDSINLKLLKIAVEHMKAKQSATEEILSSATPIPDPSL